MIQKITFVFTALFVLSPVFIHAQEQDVTDSYLSNAGFNTDCNFKTGDAALNLGTADDGSTIQSVSGWTSEFTGWSAGSSFEYGYTGTLNNTGSTGSIPAADPDGASGDGQGALGICAAWTGSVSYGQNVTLPAGTYKLKYQVYNSGPSTNGSSLAGWIPNTGVSAQSTLSSFPTDTWTADEVTFTIESETSGKIQLGVQSIDAGSGSNARLFFDDLELLHSANVLNNDASLSGISLDEGSLIPDFNSEVLNYVVIIPTGISSITVTPSLSDSNASFTGGGSIDVSSGEVTEDIIVTAEDGGTKRTYTIKFTTNPLYNWDGLGATGSGSEPNNFGWDCSPATDGWTEANVFGIRFQDNVSYSYNGSTLTGRILYIRWDGLGGTTTGSIYSFPMELEACKTYQFSAKIAWHDNAASPTFTVGINSEKDNSETFLTQKEINVPSKGVLHDINLRFTPEETGTHYFTINSSAAVLAAIRDLKLEDYSGAPFIESSVDELVFDSTKLSQTFKLTAFGLSDNISFTAPEGMTFTPEAISPQDVACGLSVTASFNSKEDLTDGKIIINSGTTFKSINIKHILPPWMAPGTGQFTEDGTWCWFQDPRAVYYEGDKKQTYSGWITSNGKVQVASYNHETGEIIQNTISPPEFQQVDDHNNPTFMVREDGRILTAYSGHFYGPMRVAVSTNPEDITSFGPEAHFGDNVTYANPYQIGDSTVMFYRDGVSWHPTINVSMNGGITWGTPQTFITGGGQRPYVKYTQDSKGGIHLTFTTGHPRNEPNNKIYYAYYKDGKFYKADGTFIKEFSGTSTALNISANEPETIYDAGKGKGWTWDIALDEEENPVILYAAFPNDLQHDYYYASWDGSKWITNHIVNSGRWFPQTPEGGSEPEPNYSGGMALDPNDPSTVYLSKQVNGVFEIYKYTTTDRGANWTTEAITQNTPENIINVRPVIPRGHKPGSFDVMWMRGKYITYSNYLTEVMYYSPNTLNADLDSIHIDGNLLDGFSAQDTSYTVILPKSATQIPVVKGFAHAPFSKAEVVYEESIPGNAVITVTSEGGVTIKKYVIEFKFEGTVSATSPNINSVRVYPNPTADRLTIELEEANTIESISLTDVNGRLLHNINEIDKRQFNLSMNEFGHGVYVLEIRGKQGSIKRKIIKNSM